LSFRAKRRRRGRLSFRASAASRGIVGWPG